MPLPRVCDVIPRRVKDATGFRGDAIVSYLVDYTSQNTYSDGTGLSALHHYGSGNRNKVADKLSKEAVELNWGAWHITEHIGAQVYR